MTGAELIAAERQRQIEAEGYGPLHDDALPVGDLASAGIAYAVNALPDHPILIRDPYWDWWPWTSESWKPTGDRVVDLTKAGALIAAEIDRELRARADTAAMVAANDDGPTP